MSCEPGNGRQYARPEQVGTPATGTFSLDGAVELAVVERSGFAESRHAGSAVVLSPTGEVLRSFGDPTAPVLARSCLKPFQAVAVLSSGVDLQGASAVIATASHRGTPGHVALVRDLLARAQLPESALKCPADWPGDTASRDALVRNGDGPASVYMNCSGKHAAMLNSCVHNGWPLETYLHPDHPLQVRIREVISDFCGEAIAASAIDGCGAPVHAVSLVGLARGIGRIASAGKNPSKDSARDAAAASLTRDILANGWVIDGVGRPDTLAIDNLGIIAKTGAEGVMVMASSDGTAVALKILDGSFRALTAIAITLLADAGAIDRKAAEVTLAELDLAVLGGGSPVGRVRVALPFQSFS